ncbi:MAG: hypothetical protein JO219_10520 [Candidatus Eremiobacteraeota bacterium]|nr:hypothetical protein [Candidatus Eremiobacteraeota bacterium]MBV8365979.1 hypothetical protein [Candidatus Eremiobacteraeota bacterium]
MAAQFDAVAELTGTFKTLFEKRNWMLAVPVLVTALVTAILIAIGVMVGFGSLFAAGGLAGMAGAGEGGRGPAALAAGIFSGAGLLFLICALVGVLVSVFGYAWAYAAAEPVWKGGDPDIGGGFNRALSKLAPLVVLGIIVVLVAGLLSWTIIVPLAVFFFCLYTIPYVMQGNQSGTGAIGASINLVKDNFGPTAMLFLGLIIVGIVAGIINAILGLIPVLGQIVAIVVASLIGAYSTLAIMRWYTLLTGSAVATAAPAPPAPPPAAPTP